MFGGVDSKGHVCDTLYSVEFDFAYNRKSIDDKTGNYKPNAAVKC